MQGGNIKSRYRKGNQEGSLRNMLREYYLAGCEISVQGKKAEPWQAAASCLREPSGYMMDFIPDEDNKRIAHIDFVRLDDDDPEEAEEPYRTPRGKYAGWCG